MTAAAFAVRVVLAIAAGSLLTLLTRAGGSARTAAGRTSSA
jgi:hypothetical protein